MKIFNKTIVVSSESLTKAHIIFCVTAIFFGGFFAIFVPPFFGVDESHHYTRAYQLSRAGFLPEKQDRLAGGQIPTNIIEIADESKAMRKKTSTRTFKSLFKLAHTTPVRSSSSEFYSFPGSAAYNAAGYLPAILALTFSGLLDFSVGLSISLSRIFMLLSYVAIVTYAIYTLGKLRVRWLVLAIALLPSSLFQASTINADSMILALSLLIFSIMIKSVTLKKLSPTDNIVLLLAALILPLIKFNYLFVSAMIFLIPNKVMLKSITDNRFIRTTKHVDLARLALILLATLLSVLWTTSVSWTADSIRAAGIGPSEGLVQDQTRYLVHNPLSVIPTAYRTLFANGTSTSVDYLFNVLGGRLGFNNVTFPLIITFGSFVIAVGSALYARKELLLSRRALSFCSILGLVVVASVFATLYLSFTRIGADRVSGVQGRYFLPLVPFFLSWLVVILPVEIRFSRTISVGYLRTFVWIMLSVVCYYYFVVTYFGIPGF